MSTTRTDLAAFANHAARDSRRRGAPHLTGTSSRGAVLDWLQWNDPNGSYLDEKPPTRRYLYDRWKITGEEADDIIRDWEPEIDPFTVEEAWEELARQLSDDYPIDLKDLRV